MTPDYLAPLSRLESDLQAEADRLHKLSHDPEQTADAVARLADNLSKQTAIKAIRRKASR